MGHGLYAIKDCQTGHIVKLCKTLAGARKARDRMNLEYGAVRYTVNGIG